MQVRRRLGAGLVGFSLVVTLLALVPAPASATTYGGRVKITTTAIPEATYGQPYEFDFEATNDCADQLRWMTMSFLPIGLSLSEDGRLAGTPTSTGTYDVVVFADVRSCEEADGVRFALTVSGGPVEFGPSVLAEATPGLAYHEQLTATGGSGPMTWSIEEGELPPGLALASDGTISGTPASGYARYFLARATDGSGVAAFHMFRIPVRSLPSISYGNVPGRPLGDVPDGTVGVPYSWQLTTSARAPYSWSIVSGALPAGLTLSPDGLISGTPSATAWIQTATLAVTEVSGVQAQASLRMFVFDQLAIANDAFPSGATGRPYDQQLKTTGGSGVPTWTVIDGELPPGLAVVPYGNVYLRGTPSEGGTFTFTLRVTDGEGRADQRTYTVVITPPVAPEAPWLGVAVDSGVVNFSWTPGFDGGSPFTAWRIRTFHGDDVIDTATVEGSARSRSISGLTVGETYRFDIAAVTAIGESPVASTGNVLVVDRPGVPTNFRITSVGDRRVYFAWNAPTYTGALAVSYELETWYDGRWQVTQAPWASQRTTFVPNLPNQKPLTFRIRGVNDDGPGAWTEFTDPIVLQGPISPGVPSFTKAVAGSKSGVQLEWSPPPSDGGSPVTAYTVRYSSSPDDPYPSSYDVGWGRTSVTFTGFSAGQPMTFWVTARNAYGTGAMSAPVTVLIGTPGKVGFQAAQPGNESAKVAWTAADGNGGGVSSYVVTPYLGAVAQSALAVTVPGTATSAQVPGLVNGQTYTFQIQAVNPVATGSPVSTAPVIVGSPTTPGFVNAVPELTSARVGWSGATANGAAVTAYEVTPYVGQTALPTRVYPATPNVQVVTGLDTGVTYTFSIVARNALGSGPASKTAPVVVGTPGPPGFQSAQPGNGSATVRFMTPPANASAITRYTVWPVKDNVVLAPQVFDTPGATTLTVTGLTNGATYSFRVAAENALGQGPYASTNAVMTGTPLAPAFPAAAPGNGSAKVVWTVAADNGSAITSYVVTPYVGSTAKPSKTFAAPASSVVFTGLTNGQTYTFRIVAKNATGSSLVSSATNAVKVGTPTGPGFPTVTADGGGTVTIKALASAANGAPITGYVITPMVGTVAKPSKTFTGTATTWVFTGLIAGTSYTFRIAALNSYGPGPYATTKAVTVT